MDRRSFIRSGCLTCAGSLGVLAVLQSCVNHKYVSYFTMKENQLIVKKTEFKILKKKKLIQLKYIVIKSEKLDFPVAVYRLDEERYHTLFLQCTHQGCELNPFETMVVCPCHGAEFNIKGEVTQGPAEITLKSFITTHDQENIYIQF